MSFEEFSKNLDKLNKNFELTTSSYSLSKKDIKQDETLKKIVRPPKTNTISDYNLDNFTEIEDENGIILLIQYSNDSYTYRGNQYYQYILCNEKTSYNEEGIAQVKNGQKIRLSDHERINKIKKFIDSRKQETIKDYCKSLHSTEISRDLTCMGYIENGMPKNSIRVIYKSNNEFDKKYVLLEVNYSDKQSKNWGFLSYKQAEDISREKGYVSFIKIENISDEIKEDNLEIYAEDHYKEMHCRIYKNPNSDEYIGWVQDLNNGIKKKIYNEEILEKYEYACKKDNNADFDDVAFYFAVETSDEKYRQHEYEKGLRNYNRNKKLFFISFPILSYFFIYPFISAILLMFTYILPHFSSNFTTSAVQNFCNNHLPYGFHPTTGLFFYIMMNVICIVLAIHTLKNTCVVDYLNGNNIEESILPEVKFKAVKHDAYWFVFKGMLGLICLIATFNSTVYNAFTGVSVAILIIFDLIVKLIKEDHLILTREKIKLLSLNILMLTILLFAIFIPNAFYPIYNKIIWVIAFIYVYKKWN